jgi:hypothetical protein
MYTSSSIYYLHNKKLFFYTTFQLLSVNLTPPYIEFAYRSENLSIPAILGYSKVLHMFSNSFPFHFHPTIKHRVFWDIHSAAKWTTNKSIYEMWVNNMHKENTCAQIVTVGICQARTLPAVTLVKHKPRDRSTENSSAYALHALHIPTNIICTQVFSLCMLFTHITYILLFVVHLAALWMR